MSTNKIAVVTGGSRGLGKNMSLHLAGKGVDVILTYNSNEADAKETVAAIQALGRKAAAIQLSTSDTSGFESFFSRLSAVLQQEFGRDRFDYLVNNAGIGINAPFAETTEEQFDQLMNIQFRSVFFLTQRALPLLNNGGGIVNISTGLARFSTPGYAAYASMKGAIETLTKYQAKELGARGIRVNVVAPGPIATEFGGGHLVNPQVQQALGGLTALGRIGQPDDIGRVVAFLCSEEAGWVNAQRIEVSGGMNL
ncbi:MAG: SDR family oxidoreductase [Candidatus Pseudobacter hemicellulosilyticus]|uniref:SDR family oxidoreductase n=1 Tax=Candidatus Pseudobacter hemicellulosilyticus TaxID=3121375 RepID=A0AAJ6BGB7_9BACT|nr:MAG: SDR family oxidoreductase [Pseudobacter sp.]